MGRQMLDLVGIKVTFIIIYVKYFVTFLSVGFFKMADKLISFTLVKSVQANPRLELDLLHVDVLNSTFIPITYLLSIITQKINQLLNTQMP